MPAGPMTRGGFAALLDPSYRSVHIESGRERPREYEQIFNIEDMTHNPMKDKQMTGLGTMPTKPEGTQFTLDRPILGGSKEWEAAPYGSAIEFTWEMYRDELFGVGGDLVASQTMAGRYREEVSAFHPLNNAFSTSYVGFTSGEALCGNHVGADGVTRRNRPTVDVGVSVTGHQEMMQHFHTLTNERGIPGLMSPTTILVTGQTYLTAREVYGSSGKPYSTDNEINPLIEDDLRWMVCHFFDTLTYWFGLCAKGMHDLWFMWRDHPIMDSFDDPWTKNAIFTLYQRHTLGGFAKWRGTYGSTG
jgi:hypothetical protein